MAFAKDTKACQLAAVVDISHLPFRSFGGAKGLKLSEELLAHCVDYCAHVSAVPTGNQSSVAWHQIHEATKGKLDGFEIQIDVSVIEFNVVDNGEFGQVMHELWPFVEIRCVVFVAFDDEVFAAGYAEADVKVLRHATDQESGIESTLVHHPRGDTRGRSLAVSAGHDQRA